MPAPTYRSFSKTDYLGAQVNTVIPAPAGIVNGDLLLFILIIAGTTPVTPTPPAGLTLLSGPSTVTDLSSFNAVRRLYYKFAASESGSYTFTHASSTSQGLCICVQNPNGNAPTATTNGGTGNVSTALGVTTLSANAWVGFVDHNWVLYAGTASPPTGTTPTFTERYDAANSLMYFAEGVLAAQGATGDKTHPNQNTDNTATYVWGAYLITVPDVVVTTTLDQEGYRWRNDDGSETTATWKAAQDTTVTLAPGETGRLRTIINATGDPPSAGYLLQVRKVGDPSYKNIDTFI